MSTLSGIVFLDMNASGQRDAATTIVGEGIVNLFPELEGKNGQLATLTEPGLFGFELCVTVGEESFCDTTNNVGFFSIQPIPLPEGTRIHLEIDDPNAGNQRSQMTLINHFEEIVTIPPNDTGPEQRLHLTSAIPIEKGVEGVVGENNIGLMQGEITMPISPEVYQFIQDYNNDNNPDTVAVLEGFDHDPSENAAGYSGDTNSCPEWNFCNPKPKDSTSHFNGTWSGHTGIDYGWAGNPEDYPGGIIPVLAAHNASTSFVDGDDGNIQTSINFRAGYRFSINSHEDLSQRNIDPIITAYGHLNDIDSFFDGHPIDDGDTSFSAIRCQRIGFMGITGSNYRPGNEQTHLHFELITGAQFPDQNLDSGNPYSKDFYAQLDSRFIIPGFNDKSHWTVFNSPVFCTQKISSQ